MLSSHPFTVRGQNPMEMSEDPKILPVRQTVIENDCLDAANA